MENEMADPQEFDLQVWDLRKGEAMMFTHRLLQWQVADVYGRPAYWMQTGLNAYPSNYFQNMSACSTIVGFCGKMTAMSNWASTKNGMASFDMMGSYELGIGQGGDIPVLKSSAQSKEYTIKLDDDGNGALFTLFMTRKGNTNVHELTKSKVTSCPSSGCWPPPPPPNIEVPASFTAWSQRATWFNTTDSPRNPLNKLEIDLTKSSPSRKVYKIKMQQKWAANVPSDFDDVWIPPWRKVLLDVSTPILGRLVIEGTLLINSSSAVDLTATWIEIKGGSLIIANCDHEGRILGAFEGLTTITLLGTNQQLSSVHGKDPRETPELTLGKQALKMGSGVLGVMGTLVAKGRPLSHTFIPLEITAAKGSTSIQVQPNVSWTIGSEIVITPSDYDMHQAEVRTIASVTRTSLGNSIIHFLEPLEYLHYSGAMETYGIQDIRMQSRVGVLSRNIVIQGEGQGEDAPYRFWNAQQPSLSSTAACGNGLCEVGESSLTCRSDCIGPAYEFGASILVGAYDEEYILCDDYLQCQNGHRRKFSGSMELDNIEMRYYGQNNLRAGLELINLQDANVSVTNSTMNRGYFRAIDIQNSHASIINGNLIFRSHLPALRVVGGHDNVISNNLACVGIFWNTHRGAIQVYFNKYVCVFVSVFVLCVRVLCVSQDALTRKQAVSPKMMACFHYSDLVS